MLFHTCLSSGFAATKFLLPKTYSLALGDMEVRVKRKTIYCSWSLASVKDTVSNKDTAMPAHYKIIHTFCIILLFLCIFANAHNFITVLG